MKNIISINAFLTLLNIMIQFCLRIYLSRNFAKEDLAVYFTLMDALTWMTLLFTGFKDALGRVFYNSNDQRAVVQTMFYSAAVLWAALSLTLIPYLHFCYLASSLSNYRINIFQIELVFFLLVLNLTFSYLLLINREYYIIGTLDFAKGSLFIISFWILYLTLTLRYGYEYLLISTVAANVISLLWLLYTINNRIPHFAFYRLIELSQTATNWPKKAFYLFSVLSTIEYSSAYVYIYLSSFIILTLYSPAHLADFQVVARPIYMGLVAVFSYPVFRFVYPEFSAILAAKDLSRVYKIRHKFISLTIIFGLITTPCCWIFSRTLVDMIFTSKYIEAAKMLNVLIIGLPFVVYTSFAFASIKAAGGFKYTLLIRLLGVASFFSFLFILRVYFDVLAVIYSMIGSVFIMFLASCAVERKILAELSVLSSAEKDATLPASLHSDLL